MKVGLCIYYQQFSVFDFRAASLTLNGSLFPALLDMLENGGDATKDVSQAQIESILIQFSSEISHALKYCLL